MVNLIYLKAEFVLFMSTYIYHFYHLLSLLVYISSIYFLKGRNHAASNNRNVTEIVRFQVNINSSSYRILI